MEPSDINQEFTLRRTLAGVQLARPDKDQTLDCLSVKDLLTLPFNTYFFNTESEYQWINESGAVRLSAYSTRSIRGRHLIEFERDKNNVYKIVKNNNDLLLLNQIKIINEDFLGIDTPDYRCLSLKFPWFDNNNKIIGIFGCSIILDNENPGLLSSSLTRLTQAGLLNIFQNQPNPNSTNLTIRQLDCLLYLTKGMSIKMIAKKLNLSDRTVENYLNNIKNKLNCSTRTELIEKALRMPYIFQKLFLEMA